MYVSSPASSLGTRLSSLWARVHLGMHHRSAFWPRQDLSLWHQKNLNFIKTTPLHPFYPACGTLLPCTCAFHWCILSLEKVLGEEEVGLHQEEHQHRLEEQEEQQEQGDGQQVPVQQQEEQEEPWWCTLLSSWKSSFMFPIGIPLYLFIYFSFSFIHLLLFFIHLFPFISHLHLQHNLCRVGSTSVGRIASRINQFSFPFSVSPSPPPPWARASRRHCFA